MGWTDYIPSVPFQIGKSLYNSYTGANDAAAANKKRQDEALTNLSNTGSGANRFAQLGESNYQNSTNQLGQDRQGLRDLASGKNSYSAEQLRQGLQQNLAAQQSMAASASPQNQAMAARTAMINAGRLGGGMAGAQALAGIQERNQAQQQLGQLDLGARGQDANVALGSRQNATGAYGAIAGNQGVNPDADRLKQQLGMVQGGLQAAAMFSDKRLKTDVKGGDTDANKALAGLRAYKFKYKDEGHGKGEQLGVMAQELETAGLGHAVFDTAEGKAVNGAKLAGANTAMLAALGRRVSELEGAKGKK